MNHLRNKQILVGITGGIAAYKAAELVRRLQEDGSSVRVVMTKAATGFITPLTLQALSGNPVHLDLLDTEAEAGMGHIELARWADAVVVAPASADFIARLAAGRADDLLTAICLATSAPIALAPAMNQQMWKHPATQENCRKLQERGIRLLGPEAGLQACGDVGYGRMREVADLKRDLNGLFPSGTLSGTRVVITAGPTQEALDPVRYLTNHSSGKMGYALAEAAQDAGASVCLISGPTHLARPERVQVIPVISALEMHEQALKEASGCDIFIAAAAVADYRPAEVAGEKIKKQTSGDLSIRLIKNPDIVAEVKMRHPEMFVAGFAAETQSLIAHARDKLQGKSLDLIIANDVSVSGIGFNSEQNAVSVLSRRTPKIQEFQPMTKTVLARQLIQLISAEYRLSRTP
jgi:phosphopantothenoylcysteine decarboxylase/phosphopantothenate--cysteine ligase